MYGKAKFRRSRRTQRDSSVFQVEIFGNIDLLGQDKGVVAGTVGTGALKPHESQCLFTFLNKLSRATIDLPASDEVVYHAQDENESEDCAGPVCREGRSLASHFADRSTDRTLTNSYQKDPFRRISGKS